MIAKIGKGQNLYGALSYNQIKVESENGSVLLLNKIPETLDNKYSATYFHQYFEPYLHANIKTEKPVRHISLNPDPKDHVNESQFMEMAETYMKEMGYGNQPYVVFKHNDIERTHIHIVTACVDRDGRKIPDVYDHPRSMAICRDLEKKYDLIPATEKKQQQNDVLFNPIDYKKGNIKSQIASVVRHLPNFYSYQNLGTYNALLSLFNITAEEVKGELHGQPKQGLVYFALDESGQKTSNPFKASLFGKQSGFHFLNTHFEKSKEKMKTDPSKSILKSSIEIAMNTSFNETEFKKQLLDQGINTVVRRNEKGRIYGITFIDHESRSVWNGSQLGKNLSANVFNDWWKDQVIEQRQNAEHTSTISVPIQDKNVAKDSDEMHTLFDFLNNDQPTNGVGLIEGLGGLLPESQAEDYEEQLFANQIRKKKKRRRPRTQS